MDKESYRIINFVHKILQILSIIAVVCFNIPSIVISNNAYYEYEYVGINLTVITIILSLLFVSHLIYLIVTIFFHVDSVKIKTFEYIILMLRTACVGWLCYTVFIRVLTIWKSMNALLLACVIVNIVYGLLDTILMLIMMIFDMFLCNYNKENK